jgi:Double zinc ribbon
MALTSEEFTAVVIIVVLAVVVAALLLFLLQRLRRRRAQLLHELKDRPELVQDRAFNRIAMARRESELLTAQGVDVTQAREQIAKAQAAFDTRSFDRAYQSAQLAHESLVHARKDRGTSLRPGPSAFGTPSSAMGEPSTFSDVASASSAAPPGEPSLPPSAPSGIPKNRAESQFQMRVLDQELERTMSSRAGAAATREARQIRTRAQQAFDRADYTESFRLALKARRALGAGVEALALGPNPGSPLSSASPSPGGVPGDPDATRTAERVAGADRCPDCGYPALPGDVFCRGCGRPRVPSACAKCGSPRTPSDTFCGRCGASFA